MTPTRTPSPPATPRRPSSTSTTVRRSRACSARSTPTTYCGALGQIRRLFAASAYAQRLRGKPGHSHPTWRAARDARRPVIAACPPHVTELFTQHGHPGVGEGTGLLEGNAGLALALHTAARTRPPVSGWDACLLIG